MTGEIPGREVLRGNAVRLRRGPCVVGIGVFGSVSVVSFRGLFAAGLVNGRSRLGGRIWLRVWGSWYAIGLFSGTAWSAWSACIPG